jgi:hypothetical protein
MSTPIAPSANAVPASSVYVPNLEGPIIDVQVGEQIFQFHEGALSQTPYFVNALKPEWVSAREGKPIDLKYECVTAFAAYQQYLYSHQIETTLAINKWCKMYVLGEMLMDREFQDAVLSVIMSECTKTTVYPWIEEINILYEGTPANSPVRGLLCDFFCLQTGGIALIKISDFIAKVPAQFVQDLLLTLLQNRIEVPAGQKPWIANPTMYFVGSRKSAGQGGYGVEDYELLISDIYKESW